MEKRTVWFVLNQNGVADDQELYARLMKLITSWQRLSSDPGGQVAYQIKCYEEHFEKLYELFHDLEFMAVWGVIKSGVVESEQLIDWPSKSEQVAPTPAQTPKKTLARAIWNALRKTLGADVIK
jgi:hypothetical protein